MADRLSPSDFLSSLANLLASSSSSSSSSSPSSSLPTNIHLTQKPLVSASSSGQQAQILIRASNGFHAPHAATRIAKHLLPLRRPGARRVKFSTVVAAADLDDFYARYADVCKRGMDGLRKRDKKKAKAKAKKKHQQQQKQQ